MNAPRVGLHTWEAAPAITCAHCGKQTEGVQRAEEARTSSAICLGCIMEICETLRRLFAQERAGN